MRQSRGNPHGFSGACLDPFRIPQQSSAQVPVRAPSEAQETFRGHAGSATGVAQTVRPQPDDATSDSQSARLSHSPRRNVRGKRNPTRRPSAGCLLCNPRVASAARTARPAAGTLELGTAEASPPHRGQRRRGGESRRVFRARRGRRRAGSPRGADAEAKASGSIHLAESCRRVPENARCELLPAPQRRTRSLSAIALSENPG